MFFSVEEMRNRVLKINVVFFMIFCVMNVNVLKLKYFFDSVQIIW